MLTAICRKTETNEVKEGERKKVRGSIDGCGTWRGICLEEKKT